MKRFLTLLLLLSFSTSFAQNPRSRDSLLNRNVRGGATRIPITLNPVSDNSQRTAMDQLQKENEYIRKFYTPRTEVASGMADMRSSTLRDSSRVDSIRRFYLPRFEMVSSIAQVRNGLQRDSISIDSLRRRTSKVESESATHLVASTAMALYQPKGDYITAPALATAIISATQLYISGDSLGISGGNKVKLPKGWIPATATLTQTAAVAIVAGDREVQVPVAGLLVGDVVLANSTTALPAGYKINSIRASATGIATVSLSAPLLAIGASYSILLQLSIFRK